MAWRGLSIQKENNPNSNSRLDHSTMSGMGFGQRILMQLFVKGEGSPFKKNRTESESHSNLERD